MASRVNSKLRDNYSITVDKEGAVNVSGTYKPSGGIFHGFVYRKIEPQYGKITKFGLAVGVNFLFEMCLYV